MNNSINERTNKYYILSCALNSYGGLEVMAPYSELKRALGRQVGLSRRTWTPSWAVQGHLGAKLGCQGALGLPLGIQLGIQVPLQSTPNTRQ